MTTDQRAEPEGLATKARAAVGAFRDFAREHGMDFRQRDPLVMDIHKAIDALTSHAEQADALARLEKENADLSAQLSGVCDDAAHTERELTEAEAALTAIKVELDDWKGRAERQYDYNVEIIAREAAVIEALAARCAELERARQDQAIAVLSVDHHGALVKPTGPYLLLADVQAALKPQESR